MTLLRYSSHHGSTPTARAAAGRTYVKTAAAGAKKSWSKSYSLTTTAAPTAAAVKLQHTNSYQWSRQEPSHQAPPPSIPSFSRGIDPQRYNGRKTTWRRPTTQDDDGQGSSQATVSSAETSIVVDPTMDTTSSFHEEKHQVSSSSYSSRVSMADLPDETDHSVQESKQPALTAHPERSKSPNSIAAEDLSGHDESSVSSASSSQPNVMKKRGAHQLVRQDRIEAPSHEQVQYKNHREESKNQLPSDSSAAPLRKIAPNKLVHSHHPIKVPPHVTAAAAGDSAMAAAKRKLLYSKQQRRMNSLENSMAPVAKRVKLSEPVVDSSSASTGTTLNGEKLMTDFAYRETSKVPSRGGGSHTLSQGHTSNVHRGRRNMGLVRVSPDEAKTPICPTFLQGVACTDESCTKRHDVPKEAATPICSYFQRQGQCSKGADCPFRHIKVNPRAVVCPSFSLLGFCQNEDCLMKHVRVHNKANHHNKTLTLKNKATEA